MSSSKTAIIFSIAGFMAFQAANRPTPPVSKAERERLYQISLKLDPVPKGAIPLELKRLIPSDEEIESQEIFFRNAHAFSVDERGHIFIPEYMGPAIYELDQEGCLIRKYDKGGQGPGEIRYPNEIWFEGELIALSDGGSRRIMYFDRDWRFLRSFSLLASCRSFSGGQDGLLFAISMMGDRLVVVLDSQGKEVRTFGELPYRKGSALNTATAAVSPAGEVWIVLQGLGKLQGYSQAGELLYEIDAMTWASPKLKENLKQNFAWAAKKESKVSLLISSISFLDGDLMVQMGGVLQPIHRLDSAGRLKATYYIEPEGPSIVHGGVKVIQDSRGSEEFFCYRKDYDEDDFRIGIYRVKTSGQGSKR